jgi:putative transcriptional regulator
MGVVRMTIDAGKRPAGRIDTRRVDATTEADLERQAVAYDNALSQEAAAFTLRVRCRTDMTQAVFAAWIGVSVDTVLHWQQGKRLPAGPAKALLKILDRAPEAALAALARLRAVIGLTLIPHRPDARSH